MLKKPRNEQKYLKYNSAQDCIQIWLTPPDCDSEAETLFIDFLLQISEQANNYAHVYRLPVEDEKRILEPPDIILRKHDAADYFNSYFHLHEARINVNALDCACEAIFYIGCKEQNMELFFGANLAVSPIRLITSGEVEACFMSVDQGADYWLIADSKYEDRIQSFLKSLKAAGYKLLESKSLQFPCS